MKEISSIKVKIESGNKYTTDHGFHAVKDGIRNKKENSVQIRKPEWLKVQRQDSKEYQKALSFLNNNNSERVIHIVEGLD